MATEEELDSAVQEATEFVFNIGNDTVRFTQEESLRFFNGVIEECQTMAIGIQGDIQRAQEEAVSG